MKIDHNEWMISWHLRSVSGIESLVNKGKLKVGGKGKSLLDLGGKSGIDLRILGLNSQ